MTKPKLCYILPRYEENDATHFSYLPDFIKEISKNFDIFLIIERGRKPVDDLGCLKIKLLKSSFLPLRMAGLKLAIFLARISGYRDFYVHYSFLVAFFASLTTKIFGGRVFYWNCGEPWKYKRNFLRQFFEKSVYRMIDFLVTGADCLARQYADYYGIKMQKIKIMPNWINLEKIRNIQQKADTEVLKNKLNISPETKIILFIHRLSKRKGAHLLPEILNKLVYENVFLLIAGDGPERKNLERKIKELRLENKTRFLGWMPNREIWPYYATADVFLMPSQEEGSPRVLLESMAFGLPFVASDVGAVKEIIPENMRHYLVGGENAALFAAKIEEIFGKNRSELEEIKRSLFERASRYDVSGAVKNFIEILS